MRTAALLSRVFLQIEEVTHIDMPRLDIDRDRPLTCTELIDCNRHIIGNLQKRYELSNAISL